MKQIVTRRLLTLSIAIFAAFAMEAASIRVFSANDETELQPVDASSSLSGGSLGADESESEGNKQNLQLTEEQLLQLQEKAPLLKAEGDSLYAAEQFKEASAKYAEAAVLQSPDIYYNLGNAEFRQKHYANAVLAYERALWLDPDHEDAQYNIALVRTRLVDRFSEPTEMFFLAWLRTWVTTHSVGHWVNLSFMWVVLFFLFLSLYFAGSRLWMRKVGFFAALVCALCFAATTAFAVVQRYRFYNNADVVIFADEIPLYASPSTSSKQLRTLHPGTTVSVKEQEGKEWIQVELPDATEGWMPNQGYQHVVTN